MPIEKKFTGLSSEQLKKLSAVKNAAELDGLLSEYGIALTGDEKAEAFTYFSTGKRPLSDDDLDMVTGGAIAYASKDKDKDKNIAKIIDSNQSTLFKSGSGEMLVSQSKETSRTDTANSIITDPDKNVILV